MLHAPFSGDGGTGREPFNFTPHGGQSDFVWLSARTPHGGAFIRVVSPDEIKESTHPKNVTAPLREQARATRGTACSVPTCGWGPRSVGARRQSTWAWPGPGPGPLLHHGCAGSRHAGAHAGTHANGVRGCAFRWDAPPMTAEGGGGGGMTTEHQRKQGGCASNHWDGCPWARATCQPSAWCPRSRARVRPRYRVITFNFGLHDTNDEERTLRQRPTRVRAISFISSAHLHVRPMHGAASYVETSSRN